MYWRSFPGGVSAQGFIRGHHYTRPHVIVDDWHLSFILSFRIRMVLLILTLMDFIQWRNKCLKENTEDIRSDYKDKILVRPP